MPCGRSHADLVLQVGASSPRKENKSRVESDRVESERGDWPVSSLRLPRPSRLGLSEQVLTCISSYNKFAAARIRSGKFPTINSEFVMQIRSLFPIVSMVFIFSWTRSSLLEAQTQSGTNVLKKK